MQKENKRLNLMLERLQQRISDVSDVCGVVVDDDLHRDLKTIVGENSEQVHAMYPKGSFQRVFWDPQEKASSLRNAKAMRQHPLFVKGCLETFQEGHMKLLGKQDVYTYLLNEH